MTESALTRRILKVLNALPRTKATKFHGGPYTEAGTPDVLVVSDGRAFWLEAKLSGEQPTPIQRRRMREWTEAGATCAVVRSVDEARFLVLAENAKERT